MENPIERLNEKKLERWEKYNTFYNEFIKLDFNSLNTVTKISSAIIAVTVTTVTTGYLVYNKLLLLIWSYLFVIILLSVFSQRILSSLNKKLLTLRFQKAEKETEIFYHDSEMMQLNLLLKKMIYKSKAEDTQNITNIYKEELDDIKSKSTQSLNYHDECKKEKLNMVIEIEEQDSHWLALTNSIEWLTAIIVYGLFVFVSIATIFVVMINFQNPVY